MILPVAGASPVAIRIQPKLVPGLLIHICTSEMRPGELKSLDKPTFERRLAELKAFVTL